MYEAKNDYIVVTPYEETESKIKADNQAPVGIRNGMLNGEPLKLSECVPLKVVSSALKGFKEGDIVYARNSFISRIALDDDNYFIREKDVALLEKTPYGDYVLCRDLKSSDLEVEGLVSNAFIYHPGTSGLNKGDVIVYDHRQINKVNIGGEELFTIDKSHIVSVVIKD